MFALHCCCSVQGSTTCRSTPSVPRERRCCNSIVHTEIVTIKTNMHQRPYLASSRTFPQVFPQVPSVSWCTYYLHTCTRMLVLSTTASHVMCFALSSRLLFLSRAPLNWLVYSLYPAWPHADGVERANYSRCFLLLLTLRLICISERGRCKVRYCAKFASEVKINDAPVHKEWVEFPVGARMDLLANAAEVSEDSGRGCFRHENLVHTDLFET